MQQAQFCSVAVEDSESFMTTNLFHNQCDSNHPHAYHGTHRSGWKKAFPIEKNPERLQMHISVSLISRVFLSIFLKYITKNIGYFFFCKK